MKAHFEHYYLEEGEGGSGVEQAVKIPKVVMYLYDVYYLLLRVFSIFQIMTQTTTLSETFLSALWE